MTKAAQFSTTLADDVRAGLTALPKALPPKYFYDTRGSALFDEITRLPEYYLTRAERRLLEVHADEIASIAQSETLIELGSGTSDKTRLLLDALQRRGTLRRFVPVDIDADVLARASASVGAEYPALAVQPVVSDFERNGAFLPSGPRRLLAFLGSTIGNLEPVGRAEFLANVRASLTSGDAFLLGTDLVKEPARLIAAYNDAAGVTAQFNRNVLTVINRELAADFDLNAFDHVAVWDPTQEWIEMRLRSVRSQVVHITGLDLDVEFAEDEEMRTEISAKFRHAKLRRELARAGLRLHRWWTDGDFGLSLALPA
jgi:L-histidine N-alpha-methyltransferase